MYVIQYPDQDLYQPTYNGRKLQVNMLENGQTIYVTSYNHPDSCLPKWLHGLPGERRKNFRLLQDLALCFDEERVARAAMQDLNLLQETEYRIYHLSHHEALGWTPLPHRECYGDKACHFPREKCTCILPPELEKRRVRKARQVSWTAYCEYGFRANSFIEKFAGRM